MNSASLREGLMERIRMEDRGFRSPCWIWQLSLDKDGYGKATVGRRTSRAHRVSYEVFVGELPALLDHECNVRACINPDHLRPLSTKENVLRGDGPCARNARKTHCHAGHPFDVENTYERNGWRICRACHRAAQTRYKEARR